MPYRFKDRVALVAGAGSAGPGWGNGKAAAALYARGGARVFCVDIDLKAAEETRDIIVSEGGNAIAHAADVSKNGPVKAMVAACIAAYGRIDVLHNNVGIVEQGNVVDASEESWDRVHDINLKSIFLTCKHVIPHMARQGKGAIVNIASTAGLRHMGISYCSYSSTKSAIIHLTHAIAMDHARQGIRANCVVPGVIHTPLVESVYGAAGPGERERLLKLRAEQVPLGRLGDAWDVAHAAAFLASDEAKYITGTELVVDGGLIVKSI